MRNRDAFNEICEIHGGLRAMHSNCGSIIPDDQPCAECGTLTNHTTTQHEDIVTESMMCWDCGINQRMDDDPETRVCRACYDEAMAWRAADNYDAQAKEEAEGPTGAEGGGAK